MQRPREKKNVFLVKTQKIEELKEQVFSYLFIISTYLFSSAKLKPSITSRRAAKSRRTRGKFLPLAGVAEDLLHCGKITVTKRAPIHYVTPINDMVHRPL